MRNAVLTLLVVLAVAGCGGEKRESSAVKANGLPGATVRVHGRRLYFQCAGKGEPTVILEAGLGGDSSTWVNVHSKLEAITRTCSYDRAGLGLTESMYAGHLGSGARDADVVVGDLETLLDEAAIDGPYVVVGHSYGGLLARVFAGRNDNVEGIVFVDSSSPGQDEALRAAAGPARPGEPAELAELRAPTPPPAAFPEHADWRRSMAEAGRVDSLDMPVVVVTAGRSFGPPTGVAGRLRTAWFRLQDRLAALSERHLHVVALRSSHFVQIDQPEVVVAAVRAAVEAARDDGELPACADVFHGSDVRCLG